VNKEQYLKQLSANLGQLKGAEREEILGDIAEYFDCAARDGESGDTIAQHLGDPKKLAREYWAQHCIERVHAKASPGSMMRAFASSAALGTINFLYVLFVVVVGYVVIAAFYTAAVAVGLAGAATLVAGIPYATLMGSGLAWAAAFAGVAVICLGILAFIGIMKLAKLFKRANMAFLNNTSKRIRRENNE
jgi:uncharacterized membrane protein